MLAAVLIAALAWAPAAAVGEADDQYAVAAGHYVRKQWDLAATEFEAFLAGYPRHAKFDQGVFFLGETLVQLGRRDDAAARFREYLGREPEGQFARSALFRLGEAAYLAGNRDDARRRLNEFLDRYPDDRLSAYALTDLGAIDLESGRAADAEASYRLALKRFPQSPSADDCRFGLAQAVAKQGREAEAEQIFGELAAKSDSPRSSDAQFHLGALEYEAGRFEEAAATLEAFESKSPSGKKNLLLPTARLVRGWALWKLDRVDEAGELFAQIADDPEVGAEACYWLALAEKSRADWKAAAESFARLLERDPDSPLAAAAALERGLVLGELGQTDAALEMFDRVAERHADSPQAADALWAAARLRDQLGRDREAAAGYERLATACPTFSQYDAVLYKWAWTLMDTDRADDAFALFQRIRNEQPKSQYWADATFRLAQQAMKDGDYAAALEDLESVRHKTQDRDDAWLALVSLRLAEALAHEKRWAEARKVAAEVEERFPDFQQQYEADYVVGRATAAQADFDAARRAYGKVIHSPTGAKTETAAKAQLMIAETYFHQKDYATALREYLRVEILYGYPELQAAAVLQAAKCQRLLGRDRQAAELIDRLQKTYPNTQAATEIPDP